MKNKTLVKFAAFFFGLLIAGTLGVSTMAWFTTDNNATPTFNGSFVQFYFDEESGDGYTEDTPLMITKPVHLYNLSRLYKSGIFSSARDYTVTTSSSSTSYTNTVPHYYFQLGKLNTTDSKYYFYNSTSADETSQTGLSSTSLDMTNYTTEYGLTVTPIGQNFTSTSNDYSFKDHFIGNGLTISNLYVDATDVTFTHAGFFGDVKDGADITSFNFDGLTIDCQDSSSGSTAMVAGLVAGYLNEGTSKTIKLKQVGVRNGDILGNEQTTSSYSLIGSGTATAQDDLTNGFGGTGGDVGIINFGDIIGGLTSSPATLSETVDFGGNLTVKYDNVNAGLDAGYYFPESPNNGFGIFSLSAAYRPESGQYQTMMISSFSASPWSTADNTGGNPVSKVKFKDYRSSTAGSGPYVVNLSGSESDYSSNESQSYFFEQVKDKVGKHISSLNGVAWVTDTSTICTQKSCFDDSTTISTYSNSLFFETAKDNQDIIFICFRLTNYPSSYGATMTLLGPKKGTDTGTGNYVSTYGTGYYDYDTSYLLRGSIFRTGKAGKYCICVPTTTSGISYCYVRVNGVSGGDFGDVTTGGIAVDFIATSATISTYTITKDNYSGAYFTLTMASAKSFVLYFRRVDADSTITVTAYYNSTLDLTTTPAELVASASNAATNSGTPDSPSS